MRITSDTLRGRKLVYIIFLLLNLMNSVCADFSDSLTFQSRVQYIEIRSTLLLWMITLMKQGARQETLLLLLPILHLLRLTRVSESPGGVWRNLTLLLLNHIQVLLLYLK